MKENIDVLVVGIEGHGYNSNAEAGGYTAIPVSILEEYDVDIDNFEFEFYVGDLDGKHSETECYVTREVLCVNEYLHGYEVPSSAKDFSVAILEEMFNKVILEQPNNPWKNKDFKKVREFNSEIYRLKYQYRKDVLDSQQNIYIDKDTEIFGNKVKKGSNITIQHYVKKPCYIDINSDIGDNNGC